jgi:hypothetical protein
MLVVLVVVGRCVGMTVLGWCVAEMADQVLPQLTTAIPDIPSSTASDHPVADEELVGLSPEIPARMMLS